MNNPHDQHHQLTATTVLFYDSLLTAGNEISRIAASVQFAPACYLPYERSGSFGVGGAPTKNPSRRAAFADDVTVSAIAFVA